MTGNIINDFNHSYQASPGFRDFEMLIAYSKMKAKKKSIGATGNERDSFCWRKNAKREKANTAAEMRINRGVTNESCN
jgi:hypothetical protein